MVLPIGETTKPLMVTTVDERGAVFSPDGRSVAIVSGESGRAEVYVQPFPRPGPKVTVSSNGGIQPMWSRDGRELCYREGEWLMAAAVQPSPFRVLGAKRLFELPGGTYNLDANFADYDVAADGRFIAARRNRTTTAEVQVVLNWTELLGTALGQR